MTPLATECNPKSSVFGRLEGRPSVTDFKGGEMTQDSGVILVSALDRSHSTATVDTTVHELAHRIVDQAPRLVRLATQSVRWIWWFCTRVVGWVGLACLETTDLRSTSG